MSHQQGKATPHCPQIKSQNVIFLPNCLGRLLDAVENTTACALYLLICCCGLSPLGLHPQGECIND